MYQKQDELSYVTLLQYTYTKTNRYMPVDMDDTVHDVTVPPPIKDDLWFFHVFNWHCFEVISNASLKKSFGYSAKHCVKNVSRPVRVSINHDAPMFNCFETKHTLRLQIQLQLPPPKKTDQLSCGRI